MLIIKLSRKMIGQSYLKRKHKIRFTKSEGMNQEGDSTVFWPLFKRYGNAEYRRVYCMGTDYSTVYTYWLVSE